MKVKVTFASEDEFVIDSQLIEVYDNYIKLKEFKVSSLPQSTFNRLVNKIGNSFSFYGNNEDKINFCVCKTYVRVTYMPTEQDRINYLSSEIDKMSSELNALINSK